jgi:hypothetical protein
LDSDAAFRKDLGRRSEGMMGGFNFIARVGVLFIGLTGVTPGAATVVVIDHTPDRIIVATDSRAVSIFGGTGTASISDAECKVFALGTNAAFVIAGHAWYARSEPNDAPTWNAGQEAQRLFEHAAKENGGWNDAMLDGLALSWRTSTAMHMTRLRQANLKQFRDAMGDIRSNAVFATAAGGSVRAVYVEATLTQGGEVVVVGPAPIKCSGKPCILGHHEIADEYLNLTSQRAKAEVDRWERESAGLSEIERARRRAVNLVEAAIAHDPRQQVGGPVDVLELHAGQKVKWIRRKPWCPT